MTAVITASSSHESKAAYDRPVTWSDMGDLDLRAALRSQYASQGNLYEPVITESMVDLALRDADQRINKEFQVSPVLKSAVRFWLRIYTQYSTQQIVIFDSNHMDVIYEVIDLKPLLEKSRNLVVYEITSNNKIKKTLELYKKALLSLAKNPHPKNPTREQSIILAKTKSLKHKHSYKDLAVSLKSMRGQRDNMIKGLLAAEAFFPKMDLIFTKMGVPTELLRLSLVESSFNLKAVSKVGASGVWQLMPALGRKYLVMNEEKEIDERRSPLKATFAAAKLLKWNYNYLGNWPLAVISYNHGLKNLPKFKNHEVNFNKMANLFDGCMKKPLLGWASRNYYSEFLAALYAETYRDLFFGKTPSPAIRPIMFKQIAKSQSGYSYALEKGISLQEFKLFNADIMDLQKPLPIGFWVAVPGETDDISELVEHSISNKKKSRNVTKSVDKAKHKPVAKLKSKKSKKT